FTEFLPVSSSGHLVMTQVLLGVPSPGVFLEVALHVATLLSVMVVYRHTLAGLLVGAVRRDPDSLRYIGLLVLASVPVGIIGLLFRDAIETAFDTPYVTGFMLLATGVILYSTTWGQEERPHDTPTMKHALGMGVAQCLALLPGMSRSGTTIAAGLWTGLKGERAAEFSFLMSLPAIGGAALLQAMEVGRTTAITGELMAGFLTALVSGVVAIKSLVWLVRRQGFHLFAWYVWPAGLLFLAYLYFS
ncbi:MAG TPA: undecaprenyl-diphosphate phosphatase, partial [Longimicrobiales bacterium]|nr:undecaprenyl-diphosphate phosphatase [Longimicrobiales bacterium]